MIDRVSIIWADGSANTEFPLTEELRPLTNVVALTAVFGPSSDKLSTCTVIRMPYHLGGFKYHVHYISDGGSVARSLGPADFNDAIDSLLGNVESVFGEDGE